MISHVLTAESRRTKGGPSLAMSSEAAEESDFLSRTFTMPRLARPPILPMIVDAAEGDAACLRDARHHAQVPLPFSRPRNELQRNGETHHIEAAHTLIPSLNVLI